MTDDNLSRRDRRKLKKRSEASRSRTNKAVAASGVLALVALAAAGTSSNWEAQEGSKGYFSTGNVAGLQISTDGMTTWEDNTRPDRAAIDLSGLVGNDGRISGVGSVTEPIHLRLDPEGDFDALLHEFAGFEFEVNGEPVNEVQHYEHSEYPLTLTEYTDPATGQTQRYVSPQQRKAAVDALNAAASTFSVAKSLMASSEVTPMEQWHRDQAAQAAEAFNAGMVASSSDLNVEKLTVSSIATFLGVDVLSASAADVLEARVVLPGVSGVGVWESETSGNQLYVLREGDEFDVLDVYPNTEGWDWDTYVVRNANGTTGFVPGWEILRSTGVLEENPYLFQNPSSDLPALWVGWVAHRSGNMLIMPMFSLSRGIW